MAIINELNEVEWNKWVSTRPKIIQEMCKKFPPDRLYKLKNSGHRVTILSYSEDETLTVTVSGEYNSIMFDRNVFGIRQDDLKECDLPGCDEVLGATFTDKSDIDVYLDIIKNS